MLHSFFLFCFFSSSLFNCSRTTMTATWKLWGWPWLAPPLSCPRQPSGYCTYRRHLREKNSLECEDLSLGMESNKDGSFTP
jgi:hypothetical protein